MTLTVVGFANHKAFWLFTVYQALAISYNLLIMLIWIYFEGVPLITGVPPYIGAGIALGIFVDFVACIGFLVFSGNMAFAHLEFITQNITTLDNMGRLDVNRSTLAGTHKDTRFMWNFGLMYNLREVGLTGWFWWFPRAHSNKYEGYYWNRIHKPREYICLRGEGKSHLWKNQKKVTLETAELMMKAAKQAYEEYTLLYGRVTVPVEDHLHML